MLDIETFWSRVLSFVCVSRTFSWFYKAVNFSLILWKPLLGWFNLYSGLILPHF